jgi:CspA family cold shock protein
MAQYKGTVKCSIQLDGYKTLKEGDEVEFDVIQGTKGPQADNVIRTKAV